MACREGVPKSAGEGWQGPSPWDTLTRDPLDCSLRGHESRARGFGGPQKQRSQGENPCHPSPAPRGLFTRQRVSRL